MNNKVCNMRGVDNMYTTKEVFIKYVFINSWVLDLAILTGLFIYMGVPYSQEVATEYLFPWQNRLELLGAATGYYILKAVVLSIYWELYLGIKIK